MLNHLDHQERGALLLQLRVLHAKSWAARVRLASSPQEQWCRAGLPGPMVAGGPFRPFPASRIREHGRLGLTNNAAERRLGSSI